MTTQSNLLVKYLRLKLGVQALSNSIQTRLQPWRNALWALGIISALAFLTWCAWYLFPIRTFARSNMKEFVENYFLAAGAAIFGLPAISFSLQSLVIQNTAENRSAGLYETEGRDRVPTLLFAFVASISLSFFFISTQIHDASLLIRKAALVGSFPVIACALWALFGLYRHTFHRMSPTKVIERTKGTIIYDLKWLAGMVRENAIVISGDQKSSGLDAQMMQGVIYSHEVLQKTYKDIGLRIEFLFDYHDKLAASQEHYAARQVLDAVREIIIAYINVRSSSSLRLPLGAANEQEEFLRTTLEDLVSRGKAYIGNGNDRGVTHVIGIFRDIVVASATMKFYPDSLGDNPVFTQCRSYLGQIVDEAMAKGAIEALYQVAKAYSKMGETALKSKLSIEFYTIEKEVRKVGHHGARKDMHPVWSASLHALTTWIRNLLSFAEVDEEHLAIALDGWADLVVLGEQHGMQDPVITGTPLSAPLNILQIYLAQVFKQWQQAEGQEKKKLETSMLGVIEKYKDKIRKLADSLRKADAQVVQEASRVTIYICKILFELSDQAATDFEKREPQELLFKFLHIPAAFIYKAGKNAERGLDALVDTIVRIGLMAYAKGHYDLAKKALELVSRTACSAAEEKVCSYGSIHAPCIMEKACYFGILALRDGKSDLLGLMKEQIQIFQNTLALHQEQMLNALSFDHAKTIAADVMSSHVMGIRGEKQKVRSAYELIVPGHEEAQRNFLPMIEVIDVDKFTLEIWGVVDGASEIGRQPPPPPGGDAAAVEADAC